MVWRPSYLDNRNPGETFSYWNGAREIFTIYYLIAKQSTATFQITQQGHVRDKLSDTPQISSQNVKYMT